MAKKTTGDAAAFRGTKLLKKAIELGRGDALSEPEPVASAVIKKMTLPNGEPISAAMKELLKVDSIWLGMDFDDEEGDIEASSLEELIEDHFGKTAVAAFGEAIDLFEGDCIALGGASEALRFLYVGEPDESGEYPVMTALYEPAAWIGGFVPFDVWVAQELGAIEAAATPGGVPQAYEEVVKELAASNGDGRLGFVPVASQAATAAVSGDDDEDEDDDDEEDDDEDDEEGEKDDSVQPIVEDEDDDEEVNADP